MTRAEPKLVLVEWVDSAQPVASWRFLAEAPPLEAICCVSVGWVVGRSAEVIMLAPNLGDMGRDEPGQASGFIRIPASAVRREVELAEVSALPLRDSE